MRRFVALFAKNKSSDNRKDKHNSPHPPPSDPPSSISSVRKRPSKVLPNSPLNLHPPHPPSLRQGSFGNTSSSSSDVSSPSAPHTPDDDPRNAKKWKIWSGSGSQNSSKLSNTSLKTPSIVVPDDQWPALTTEWVPPDDAAFLRPASRQAPQPPPPVPSSFGQARKSTPSVASSDNEESESESEESDEFAGPVTVPISTPPRRSLVLTSTNTAQPTLPRPPPSRLNPASYTKLHALTLASLIPTPSPPPLLHFPSAPLFPRSSNPPHSLSSEPSLLSILHKKHILRRLESRNLTPLEEASIASFADRPRVSPRPPPPKIPEAMSDVKRLDSYSRGLHRWIYRPCFEERVSVWTMSVDGYDIVKDRVTGSGTAVLDLEFSPGLEALAGYGSSDLEEDTGAIISPAFTTTPSSGSISSAKATSFRPLPSPLRVEHVPQAGVAGSSRQSIHAEAPKRGVRFTTDPADEDNLPLAVTVQAKKQLRLEQERIEREEQELRYREEKKAREEERRKKQYAEEVIASRLRSQAQRGVIIPGSSRELDTLTEGKSSHHLRPVYDSSTSRSRSSQAFSETGSVRSGRSRTHGSSGPYSSGSRSLYSGEDGVLAPPYRDSSGSRSRTPTTASPTGSSEDLRRVGNHSSSESIQSRSRKTSERPSNRRHSTRPDPSIPPVPFLARDWETQEIPLPSAAPQRGPFMASLRSHRPPSLASNHSTERLDLQPPHAPFRPEHARRASEEEALRGRPRVNPNFSVTSRRSTPSIVDWNQAAYLPQPYSQPLPPNRNSTRRRTLIT